jgi:hypothetical protein
VREEVIAHEEAHEDKVVDDSLQIEPSWDGAEEVLVSATELLVKVLTEHPHLGTGWKRDEWALEGGVGEGERDHSRVERKDVGEE